MELPPEPENPRKSGARERHQRRKDRQGGMAHTSVSAPRQLRPADSFKLPKIRLPGNRVVFSAIGSLAFIVLVIYALSVLKNRKPIVDSNAIWLGSSWTYENPTDDALSALVGRLRDNHIGTVYAWVSLLQPDNSWTDVAHLDSLKTFVERLKGDDPTVKIYGWLSIGSQGADGNNRLGDENFQKLVSDFSQRVAGEFGFDGVLLNVVPVADGDEGYLSLLRKIRAGISTDTKLAVAVPPDWTPQGVDFSVPTQIAPGTVWEEGYKQRVALLADQLFVADYNAGFSTADDYSAWVAYQVETFAKAIADLDTTTELIIGVPTYDIVPPDHDPAIENPASAIEGIHQGMTAAGDAASVVTGIGIYAEWETSAEEWDQIRGLWGSE